MAFPVSLPEDGYVGGPGFQRIGRIGRERIRFARCDKDGQRSYGCKGFLQKVQGIPGEVFSFKEIPCNQDSIRGPGLRPVQERTQGIALCETALLSHFRRQNFLSERGVQMKICGM